MKDMKKKDNQGKDIPRAVAEGDKLPEEKVKNEPEDEMNARRKVRKNKHAPKANAEGDKLPEEEGQKED